MNIIIKCKIYIYRNKIYNFFSVIFIKSTFCIAIFYIQKIICTYINRKNKIKKLRVHKLNLHNILYILLYIKIV